MNKEDVLERYRLSRKCYVNKEEIRKLLDIDKKNPTLLKKTMDHLRCDITNYLRSINQDLKDPKYLPTDLVFQFCDNKLLLKQIEKDYKDIMSRN